jgi:ubiquitin carboxyl-terminal hydrolase 36/42
MFQLRCCNCNRSSNTNESLIDLSLELENVDTLLSALKSFAMVETVVFKCEGCEEEVSMEKQLLLDQTPSIDAFHYINEDEDNNVCFFIYLFTYISLVNSLY